MQEIRDFIYGQHQVTHLFAYPNTGKKPLFLGVGTALEHETKLKNPIGDFCRFEILGANLWKGSKDTIAPPLPPKLLDIISSPTLWDKAQGKYPKKIHAVWGVSNMMITWELLHRQIPTIEEMKALQTAQVYDRIMVCQYSSQISCIEVCEMIIRGGFEPRYPRPLI